MRRGQDVQGFAARHLAVEVDGVRLERESARARVDLAALRRVQFVPFQIQRIPVRIDLRRSVEVDRARVRLGADRRRIDKVQGAADIDFAGDVLSAEVDVLEAVLDLAAAEEIRAERQPRARLADVDVGPRRRLLKLQRSLAGDCLAKGHLVRRELDVALVRSVHARLDARNGTRRNRRPRGRRDRADRQLVRFHVDRIGVRRERADLVVLVEGDAAARGSHRAVAVQAGGDHGEIVRLDLARCLSGVLQCVHGQDLARGKRHVAREVDVLRLQCRVLPERRACHIDRILLIVSNAVMREPCTEYVRKLSVRQLEITRCTITKSNGLCAVKRADAKSSCARD